jgi:hypothetical protein
VRQPLANSNQAQVDGLQFNEWLEMRMHGGSILAHLWRMTRISNLSGGAVFPGDFSS